MAERHGAPLCRHLPELILKPDALVPEQVTSLRDELLSSPYVGNSPLLGTFEASRGFAITFTHDGLSQLDKRFACLMPFVQLALRQRSYRRLFSWRERLLHRLTEARPNAFYLNLLVVPAGAAVGPHVDKTLQARGHESDVFPLLVSVLYLKAQAGGLLRLSRDGVRVADVEPTPGALLHFRGDLTHEVTAVDPTAEGERVSLVCEQYCLGARALDRIPPMAVKSQGRFAAYLEAAKHKPKPDIDLG